MMLGVPIAFTTIPSLLNLKRPPAVAIVSRRTLTMAKYILTVSAVFVLLIGAMSGKEASAQGLHFGGGGVHVDVGYPHGGGGYGHYYPQTTYWGGGWGGYGGHSWHDTTHYDYHPGGYGRHFNHYDYRPGHFDVHFSGHRHHDHF